LRAGNTFQALKALGLDGFNQSLTTQAVGKINARLAQNAQSAFGKGTRITNFLEQTYQRSLPGLWNTPEGIKLISKINKLTDQASLVEQEAATQILRNNNWRVPPDIDQLVREQVRPIKDDLERQAMDAAMQMNVKEKFSDLPDPKKYSGKTIRDTNTGAFLKSDGKEWKGA